MAQTDPFTIEIEGITDADPGSIVTVSIMKTSGTSDSFDAFDFIIEYDPDQLTPVMPGSAEAGDLIDNGVFDLFDYDRVDMQYFSQTAYGIRVYGYLNDGIEPQNQPIAENGELAKIYFEVLEDSPCVTCALRFFWWDCASNDVGVPALPPDGTIPGYLVSQTVYDFNGLDITDSTGTLPSHGGFTECPPEVSFDMYRYIEFHNGYIRTSGCDGTGRGDINLNFVPYEVADYLIFANYFIYGLSAFTINVEGQVAQTDVNADGLTLSFADFIYLIRTIEGYIPPLEKSGSSDITGDIIIADTDTSLIISTDFSDLIGGMLIDFDLGGATDFDAELLDGAAHLDNIQAGNAGAGLRMMLSRIRSAGEPPESAAIDSGFQYVAEIFYDGDTPQFVSATLIGFQGQPVVYNLRYADQENIGPRFLAYPHEMSNDSAGIFYHEFESYDANGDQVKYRLMNGPGTLDSLTGLYSFGPVCSEFGSEFSVEMCAEDGTLLCPMSDDTKHAWFNLIFDNPPPMLGDVNNNGDINILDIIDLIEYKFKNGPIPIPLENSDVNQNGDVEILDIIALINYKFHEAEPPGCQ